MGQSELSFPPRFLGLVIEEDHQGPGMAHEGAKKVIERLVHPYSWPGMKKDVQFQRAIGHS